MSSRPASENIILGSLLLAPEEFSRVGHRLSPAHFADPKNRALFSAIADLHERGAIIDHLALLDQIPDEVRRYVGVAHIGHLLDWHAESEEALDRHVEQVRKQAKIREFERTLRHALQSIERNENPEEIWALTLSRLSELGDPFEERSEDSLGDIAMELVAQLEQGERGFHWPFPELEEAVGLIVPGRLWLVSGFSGTGKSVFLRSLALGLLEHEKGPAVTYFAIEEPGVDVLGLMACALTGVNYTRYGHGYALSQQEIDSLVAGVNWIHQSRLTLNRRRLWTPVQLLARIRRYADEGKAQVVIIDHAHLIDYPGRTEKEVGLHIARFAEQLHAYSDMHQFTAFVAYQPRKPDQGGDIYRPVSPDEIRDTSRLWNIANNTLSPYRPWVQTRRHGGPILGPDGLPIRVKPGDRPRPGSGEDWVAAPVTDWFYIQPGKARIGGPQGKPVVLAFDNISARISGRRYGQAS